MKNILIIGLVVAAVAYMFILMLDKYETIKETNAQIDRQKSK